MEVRVPYGRTTVAVDVPELYRVDVIDQPDVTAVADPVGEVCRALDHPVGGFDWAALSNARSAAIAINDKTRPVPHRYLLPALLDRLTRAGVDDDAITFHIAVGGHPPMEPGEFADVVPDDVRGRCRVVSHDADRNELVHLGATSRGTPVWVDRGYAEADVRIVVGTIEPHQFVGFSGGVKTAAIGLAGRATIDANHFLMTDPSSRIGTYAANPARQDVEEIGRLIGVALAVNVIVDRRREIVRAIAGEPVAVMQRGAPEARRNSITTVSGDYPVVITSPGGHPKDIDVYQSQKAVAAAAQIVRPGGTIVLVAACPDGAGSDDYARWVVGRRSTAEVLEVFRAEGFRVGPHKAYQLARDAERARLLVCSEMSDGTARSLLLEPVPDLRAALDGALAGVASGERVAVLPHASTTIPFIDA